MYNYSVDYDIATVDDILDTYKSLMKKHNIKYCLNLLKNFYQIVKFWCIVSHEIFVYM